MWPEREQTERWVAAAQAGDTQAAERLLASHREPLRRLIAARLDPMLARRLDASDIVQDVLLEANQRLAGYLQNPEMPFHLWLRHLAMDRIIDVHRRHRLAQRRSVDREESLTAQTDSVDASGLDWAASLVDQARTPASEAIRRELYRRVTAAVLQLTEADREILLLRHQEQLTNQEAALVLGISEAAASMRYLRALRRLRSLLLPSNRPSTDLSDNAAVPPSDPSEGASA
ncbi:MAG: sigma-70 family RNA polymerase sigma factor [Gemmataceae bacterium]|nr:sigma-70 family RNA polymerase sigma factor [Gemmataceae bacterium]MCS7269710.1 sigma-70 family RNA polymerase sigma factor [Gemmataceae bacterium]MDW8242313.1 sigma-70 family RNA polymerase sigma factor [Thermogemmata sp.]